MGSCESFGRKGREVESFPLLVLETWRPVDGDVVTFRGLPADAGSDGGVAFDLQSLHSKLDAMLTERPEQVIVVHGDVGVEVATQPEEEHPENELHRTAHFLLTFLAHGDSWRIPKLGGG